MKIAVILFGDYIYDGRVQRTSRTLSSKYDVRVFGIADNNSKKYPKVFDGVNIEIIKLKTKDLPKNQFFQIFKFIEYIIITTNQINKFNPDVLHCNDVFTLFFGWFFKFKKKKFVYDSHELWMDSSHKYLYNAKLFVFLRWLERVTIRKTNAVITVGEHIAKILQKQYKIKIPIVIMNINVFSENIMDKSNIIRNRYHISESKKIILFIGALSSGRGLDKIIESIQYWKKDIIFALLGYGPLKYSLRELSKKFNIEEKVYFLGVVKQDKVLKYALSCDAGIMATQKICLSYYHGLPNKFFQIVQCKKPILASNFPVLKKIITNYKLGYTFNPEYPREIANAVNELFETNFSISNKNYEKFTKDYNWENENKKILNLYKKLEM